MSLTGVWQNSYGSVMSLTQYDDGLVSGRYSSSTGSTGTYFVLGFADPAAPTTQCGQAVALTIFWRSIDPGTPDPSWHWVSGLGGQLVPQNGVPTLYLLHALVATDDFPGLAPPGSYLDKLIYLPKTDVESAPAGARPTVACAAGDPIAGSWVCEQDDTLRLQLELIDAQYGVVGGTASRAGSTRPLYGFTDSYAAGDGLPLQGLSLALAYDPLGGRAQCLAGWLDRATDRIEVTVFSSRGTAADATYVQTAGSALSFRRGG